MVRARIVSTSEGKKRKQPEADDSVDEDMGQIERVKDDGDEQALTTGIDEKSLKAAVWYTVAQIAQEEEIELGRSMSEPFVASLTELVYAQAEHLALELKAFAAHAGRCTIREEDVKLVCRKSTVLQELLEEEAQRCNTASSTLMAAGTKNAGIKPKKLSKPKPVRVGGLAGTSTSRNLID
ncbi:hypothetical protein Pst134EA_000166 [Puccinia striiformis f. sp. tritici]|uniref:Centromere protein S n=1 Tax=Puccinia striiformis f. sp. tritici PST-78 TaxID=1165861 RepID=A0A0L0VBH5_9BASI|nr:hypothetical protein Pst134EA_000166 [Puccinia striiformis f. sp. tritici]KAH9466298.1 hypothetical protein Pst134EB_001353 [Puccinia striiformis f. sp. tritici]KAH9473085.1 hypothetical protein Pst134EA_000166 [Puccinia striiformis f. sp. tritici]KNE96613.1 hypothetical protein PSTG_10172 [Puccinia striiformis f. sp. tritici PST-78]